MQSLTETASNNSWPNYVSILIETEMILRELENLIGLIIDRYK